MGTVYIPSLSEIQAVAQSWGGASEAPDLWRGIRLWMPLQEGGGLDAFDASGYGKHAKLTNMDPATDRVVTEMGRALEFDETADQHVDTTLTLPLIAAGQGLSLAVWFKTTQTKTIIGLAGHDLVGNLGLMVGTNQGKGRIWINNKAAIGTIAIDDDVWHLIVVHRNGTTGSIYIDGQPDGTIIDAAVDDAIPAKIFRIGWWGNTGYDFTGQIASVTYWTRTLNRNEIQQLYERPWDMGTLRSRVFPAAAVAPPAGHPYYYEMISQQIGSSL